jgi:hypothetical protein
MASISAIRRRIAELKRIDLLRADIGLIKSRLEPLILGLTTMAPQIDVNDRIYRGVPWDADAKPTHHKHVSYPPPQCVRRYGRVNRAGQPMFYCTNMYQAPPYELACQLGQHVATSRWRVVRRLVVQNCGFSDESLANLSPAAPVPFHRIQVRTLQDTAVYDFFSSEFTRAVQEGDEHLYKLSIAIAERLCDDTFPGIMYPAVAFRGLSGNYALFPQYVDNCLQLESVEWLRVNRCLRDPHEMVLARPRLGSPRELLTLGVRVNRGAAEPSDVRDDLTSLDYATTFGDNGEIQWKGHAAPWMTAPGKVAMFGIEGGCWVVRDEHGNVISNE